MKKKINETVLKYLYLFNIDIYTTLEMCHVHF